MNFECLSPDEVRWKYKQAVDKPRMVRVLADLCVCTTQEMSRFLGVAAGRLTHPQHPLGKAFDRKRPVKIDPEQVQALYHEGLSDREIAETLNCSRSPIGRIRRELGLPTHNPQPRMDFARVAQLYKQGMTDREIAQTIGANRRTVAGWRHRNCLPANQVAEVGE